MEGLAKRARLSTGRVTSAKRALPDFLIIGAQRAGTTSLYSYLAQHRMVVSAMQKEIHYFDVSFHRGLSWYRAHFPLSSALQQASSPTRRITGEATPNYLFDPSAAERVASVVPDAKLIVLLRNPVERAHSHWRHTVRAGYENLAFEEAILQEESRNDPHYAYLARGLYAGQLERWMAHFDSKQLLVLRSEDLFAESQPILDQLAAFLDIPAWTPEDLRPRFSAKGQGLEAATRVDLVKYFEEPNQRLYELLGRDLRWD
jgi:hypothetical protein